MIYIKSILLNACVLISLFAIAYLAHELIDVRLGLLSYASSFSIVLGIVIVAIGLLVRLWATHTFFRNNVSVLSLNAHTNLVQTGPYRFTRNPLYIGIMLIFLGCVVLLGSYGGLGVGVVLWLVIHLWLCFYEEKDLEQIFGEEYRHYKQSVQRWF